MLPDKINLRKSCDTVPLTSSEFYSAAACERQSGLKWIYLCKLLIYIVPEKSRRCFTTVLHVHTCTLYTGYIEWAVTDLTSASLQALQHTADWLLSSLLGPRLRARDIICFPPAGGGFSLVANSGWPPACWYLLYIWYIHYLACLRPCYHLHTASWYCMKLIRTYSVVGRLPGYRTLPTCSYSGLIRLYACIHLFAFLWCRLPCSCVLFNKFLTG